MYIKMNIENVIAAFVELMLSRFSDPKTVLVMSFELRAEKEETSYAHRRTIHFMFWRPNNYTKVFWNIPPIRHQRQYREWRRACTSSSMWNLSADHDSEWRDGIGDPFRKLDEKIRRNTMFDGDYLREIEVNFLQEPKLVKVAKLNYDREKQKATVEFAKE